MTTDIRVKIRALAEEATALHMKERKISLESVYMVEKLESLNACGTLDMRPEEFAKFIGLSANMYWMRLRVARVLRTFPSLIKLYEENETEISHIAMLLNKLTPANETVILLGIRGKTKREVESFLSRVTPKGDVAADEGITEITLRLTDSEQKIFDRAREVISHGGRAPTQVETILEALDALIEKRDPMCKAERSAARASKRNKEQKKANKIEATTEDGDNLTLAADTKTSQQSSCSYEETHLLENSQTQRKTIPASVRHRVWLRDGGKCTFVNADGRPCDEDWMLELDHIKMVCQGGSNEESNLRLLCRYHNRQHAIQKLGADFMGSWTKSHSITHEAN